MVSKSNVLELYGNFFFIPLQISHKIRIGIEPQNDTLVDFYKTIYPYSENFHKRTWSNGLVKGTFKVIQCQD